MLYKWAQYHFLMVFMMVYINSCSLLVCQMNIYWDSTHIDVNWRQFNVKMIENTQNRQFLLCKWPQYHFSMFFMKVYIIFCSLLVCQLKKHTYWRQLASIWRQKWSKMHTIFNFCCVNDHNTTFLCFLWWYISVFVIC